jgi:2-hydroxychromene-2-carboxylate isomerase
VSCDDGDPCTADSCDPQTGACVHTPLSCDDGDACTVNDRCVPNPFGGTECRGDPKDCQDGDPCTEDTCVPGSGECAHAPVDCDDGDACTSDSCAPLGCLVPDNGGGTADLPPAGCGYTSQSDDLMIIDGLPQGTTIRIPSELRSFSCPAVPGSTWVCTFPSPTPGVDCSQGTPAGGERSCADSVLAMHMVGTGALAGFVRDIPLGVSFEERLDPRAPGAPLQCPVCPRAARELDRLVADFQGDLRVELHHSPLPMHRNALDAAAAAKAAQRQGRFWEYHEALLAARRFDREALLGLAATVGLDRDAFARDFDDPELRRQVAVEAKGASDAGARGTPGFLIDGHVEVGWASLSWLERAIRAHGR